MDIRNFFGSKGSTSGKPPLPSKPVAKKEDDGAKRRGRSRKIVAESDSEAEVVEAKKPAAKAPSKKKTAAKEVEGTPTTASDYFASSAKGKPSAAAAVANKSESAEKPKIERDLPVQIRSSPRNKKITSSTSGKRSTTSSRNYVVDDDDDDVHMEDNPDGADDIFADEACGRNKRKQDDYVDEDSEDDDDILPTKIPQAKPAATDTKKRKPPAPLTDDDEEEKEPTPAKKSAPKKPRKAPVKKSDHGEDPSIQAILNDIPTVRPPTPPPIDPNAPKFDWRKKAGGGGNSNAGPVANPTDELPEGEEECLAGLTFVFTGQLTIIAREDAQTLIKRYGGKITGQPSSKTSYVVLGQDAGPSKLAKIRSIGIKTIDETGLFELIRRLPAHGGSGKGAEKAREQREKEEQRIKEEAAQMDRDEKVRKVEAEKAAKAAAKARPGSAVVHPPPPPLTAQLWTTKYAPTQPSHICGNKAAVERIQAWLRNWTKSRHYEFTKRGPDGMGAVRAIIVSGPPGIGKTTACHLAAKLEGYDVIEQNASDARSKKLVENGVSEIMNNTSLNGYFAGDGKQVDTTKKKIALIMDEVDGMSAGDRGGVGALAKFCKKTDVPLILICNDRKLQKMKPFDHVAHDIKFQRPTVDQIRSRMMTICHREGMKLLPQVLNALIDGSNRDIRQIINMLSTIKLDQSTLSFGDSQDMSKAWEKSIVLKPWDICQKMLAGGLFSPASKASLNDKIELYFNDHDLSFLMIQENYLRTRPSSLNSSSSSYTKREMNLKALDLVDKAAESISDGDLVDRMIRGQQHWSLMPLHGVFSTVRPASFVAGQLLGSNFTAWLGNNSKAGAMGRMVREVASHMRLRTSADVHEVRQSYLPVLWARMVDRLAKEGRDAVPDVIELMDSYFLTRDDFDSVMRVGVGRMAEEDVSIDTQTKMAFTRTYNTLSHPIPFIKASTTSASAASKSTRAAPKEVPDLEEAMDDQDDDVLEPADEAADAEEEEEEEDNDIKGDKYIKQPKARAKTKARAKNKKGEADSAGEEAPKAKRAKTGARKAKK